MGEHKALIKVRKLATDLDGLPVTIVAKVNDKGKLFAAVSAKEVVKAIKKEGFDIEIDQVRFNKPIKEMGEFAVNLELAHGLEAEIQLTVEAEL